jgi:hypothetical protein
VVTLEQNAGALHFFGEEMAKHKRTVEQRFWAKVIKTDDCWIWIGAIGSEGYGRFTDDIPKTIAPHRYSYKLKHGAIPEGMVVRHMCHNPLCVNPVHLKLGTQEQNIADKKHNTNKNPKRIKLTKEEKIQIRFWTYVDKNGPKIPHMETNCWAWIGGVRGEGYGGYWNGKTNVIAPRYSYELTYGPITEGNLICHKCDNPKCVRPDHLFEGTPGDNSRDRTQKGRQRGGPERGSRHHSAKLNEDKVLEIRRIWDNTPNKVGLHEKIGKSFGVSAGTISGIVKRVTWIHI